MKRNYCFLLFYVAFLTLQAQTTYDIDAFDGQTVMTCDGLFTDSRSGGDYFNNEDYTVTFCSDNGDFLKFIFNPGESNSTNSSTNYDIVAGDTLYVYDGIGTSGTLIDKLDAGDDPGADHFILYSQSTCITFNFISDAAGDNEGWQAEICCIPTDCGTNPPAADEFADAPYICNLDGFCGTTSGYTEDNPFNMTGGGNCPTLFGGTLENNSWLQFEATMTSIDLEVTTPVCYNAFGTTTDFVNNGIQMGIFEFDGSMFTRVSDCNITDGNHAGTFMVSSTTLVVGNTYYIMVDGNAGARCDYYIQTLTPSIAVVDAGADQVFCAGDAVTLMASGPSGATYSWTGSDNSGPFVGASVVVNPTMNTTYTLAVTGGGLCENETATVELTLDANCCVLNAYYSNTIVPATYQTGQTIGSNGTVAAGTNVSFLSGCILLEHPFEVELNAEFLGDIDPCQ